MNWLNELEAKLQTLPKVDLEQNIELAIADQQAGQYYLYTDEIIKALQVAYALGRPLYLSGSTGCGKSSLAKNIALQMNCKYLEAVIQSDSVASDLFYSFDHISRLADAQAGERKALQDYIIPGVLWQCYQPGSAAQYLPTDAQADLDVSKDSGPGPASSNGCVLLIDEIDKAPAALPNDLLDALGDYRFTIKELKKTINLNRDSIAQLNQKPLIIITSNGEREMPAAFLRRCIHYQFPAADRERLIEVAKFRLGGTDNNLACYDAILTACEAVEGQLPEIALFLDTINAANALWAEFDWQRGQLPDALSQIIALTVQ